jgi:hypothetical protein
MERSGIIPVSPQQKAYHKNGRPFLFFKTLQDELRDENRVRTAEPSWSEANNKAKPSHERSE